MGAGTGGAVEPIISPTGGHGVDAVRELGGHYVMMNVKLEQDEGADFSVANDFREVGILKDPYNFGTTTLASSSTARQTYKMTMTSAPTTPFEVDEKITQSTTGAVGRIVEWDAANNIIYYVQERYENYGIDADGNLTAFSGSNTVTGSNSGAAAVPTTYENPELEPNSGQLLYVENRRPISRASDQTEDIKIVVEF
jgi:hypothetical protein